ncbi:MAG: hypothetical protein HFG05_09010 [Oscillibacter sp.]|nr:hypothetical protein [Oscillibacter sp.]
MKHFIWMLCGIFISGLLLGTLSACGAPSTQTGPEAAFETAQTSRKVPEAEEPAGPATAPDGDTARRAAYGKALWDAYLQGVLPGGEALDWLNVESAAMADGPEYLRWRDAYVGGAEEIEPAFQPLTEENIAALGCPKPEYPGTSG